MRNLAILTAMCGFMLLAAGCSNCSSDKFTNCDVGWDFYSPCNLIEGQAGRCCEENPCGVRAADTGIEMYVNDCVSISGGPSEAIVIEEEIIGEEIIEDAPAEIEIMEEEGK